MTAEFSSEFQLKPIESSLYQCGGTAVHRETMTREVKGIGFYSPFFLYSELSAHFARARRALNVISGRAPTDKRLGKTCPAACQPPDIAIRFT
jgi:hypothetical protein